MEWSEFLTPEEKEQMAVLMKTAEERKKKIRETDAENQFMLLGCQCGCMNQMNEKNRQTISSCMGDMKQLLNIICNFCREHGCCVCQKDDDRRGDEELPFG